VTVTLRLGLLLVLIVALATPGTAAAAAVLVPDATTATEAVPADGVVAAGDDAVLVEGVRNVGGIPVTGVSATLTATDPVAVHVTQAVSAYPDIAAGGTASNTIPFGVTLADSLPCGATLDFTLTVTSSAGTSSVSFAVVTGMTGDSADYAGSSTVIGDAMPTLRRTPVAGLSGLTYYGSTAVTSAGTVKDVQVVIGDLSDHDTSHLEIALIAPDGTQATLVDHRGGPGGAFSEMRLTRGAGAAVGSATSPFTGTFRPDGDLGALVGTAANGIWQLVVAADSAADIGRLSRWTLRLATADCTPRARLSVSPSQISPGQSATLDASRSVSTTLHGIIKYQYDYDDAGSGFTDGTALQAHTFTRQGSHTVTVLAIDSGGIIGSATTTLVVSSPPTAAFAVVGGSVKQGQTRSLTAAASADSDGTIVSYAWDTDDDGAFDDATGVQPAVWFPDAGARTIGLRVTDNDGAIGVSYAAVTVDPTVAPVAAISATPNPVAVGAPVLFDASASHDTDGTISSYEWDLDGDGSFETQSAGSPLAGRAYPNATVLNIGVRVTDNDQRTAVAHLALVIQAPASQDQGVGAGDPFAGPPAGGSTGGGAAGAPAGQAGPGGGGGGSGAGAGVSLAATLAGSPIQALKIVAKSGLALRCSADRAATCTVTATLQAADARRLGLSRSRTKAYVLGHATARLGKAGAATLTVRVARAALTRLKRVPRVTVLLAGTAVDTAGGRVTLRRAVLLRR
jgi:subtilisin-like proprotein convertase family protein